jgi:elongation factor G
MALEIEVPSQYVGDVLSDLTVKRRAQVKDIYNSEQDLSHSLVIAHAPLAGLLGYATAIRSMTQGEGGFSMEFLEFSSPMDDHAVDEAFANK